MKNVVRCIVSILLFAMILTTTVSAYNNDDRDELLPERVRSCCHSYVVRNFVDGECQICHRQGVTVSIHQCSKCGYGYIVWLWS